MDCNLISLFLCLILISPILPIDFISIPNYDNTVLADNTSQTFDKSNMMGQTVTTNISKHTNITNYIEIIDKFRDAKPIVEEIESDSVSNISSPGADITLSSDEYENDLSALNSNSYILDYSSEYDEYYGASSNYQNYSDTTSDISEANSIALTSRNTPIESLPSSNMYTGYDEYYGASSNYQNYSDTTSDISEANSIALTTENIVSDTNYDNMSLFGFEGISGNFSMGNMTCDNCIPADIQISVGKDHIIEMVNEYIGIFDKQGNLLRNETIIQFFRILNGSIENPITSDPYIVYDHIQNKWFVSLMILDVKAPTPSNRVILLSESANDNPLGVWNSKIVRLDTDTFAKCIDRPALSITQKYLVVSANMGPQNRTGYCSGEAPVGSKLIVLNKNDLMLEDDLSFFNLTQYGQLSLLPINSKGIGNSICFIGNTMAAGENVWLYSVKNINDTFVLSKAKLGPFLNPMYNPTGGIQPNLDTGDEKILHTGDSRILDTSYHEGKIWNVFNTSCKVTQDNQARTCIGLFQINTGNSSSQLNCSPENSRISFDPAPIGGNGFSLYYPSIEFDTNGNAFVIYGYSSKESFPSLGLLALTENNNNILLSKKELVKGDHPANDTKNYRCEYSQIFYDCNRHGDYFGSSSDPADPSAIWLAGVYYNDDHYSTYIIKVSNLG